MNAAPSPVSPTGQALVFGAQHHPTGWDHSEGLDHPCSILPSLPAAGVGTGISFWISVGVSCSKESLQHAGFGAFPALLAPGASGFPGGWELGGSCHARTGSWGLCHVSNHARPCSGLSCGCTSHPRPPIVPTRDQPRAQCPPSPSTAHFLSLDIIRATLGAPLRHIPGDPGQAIRGVLGARPPLHHTGMPFVLLGVWGNSAALGFSLLFWKFKTFAGRPTRALPPRREALG